MSSNIFLYFIQKTINQTGQIYETENIYSYWENIFLHQFSFNVPQKGAEMNGLEQLLCASSMRKGVKEIQDQNSRFLTKILFYNYFNFVKTKLRFRNSMLRKHIILKFRFLKETLDNIFLNNEIRDEFLEIFCQVQKLNHAFNRLAYLYKLKKADFQVREDIFLNPILENHKNTMTIFQNNKKYLFVASDLINIVNTAIGHCVYFIASPLIVKNPYNNMPFDRSILYNIYFFIKSRDFKIPILLHFYFLSNFVLNEYTKKNESIILEEYLKKFVRNSSVDTLHTHILKMIEQFNDENQKKILIHKEFPKDVLVDKMRHYLYCYLLYLYDSHNFNKSNYYYLLWDEKMKQLQRTNPEFGRKIFHTKNKYNFKFGKKFEPYSFNDICINFYYNFYR